MEKILLIDDDEALIHFLTRFFQRKRCAVTACLSGREAIDVISKENFDLILLDYKMPDFNGLDVLTEIRKVEAKTPVILMTAYGTTDLAIEAMKRGAYDYLVKPFEHKDLTHVVGEALKTNRQMKEIVRFPAAASSLPVPQDRGVIDIVGNSKKCRKSIS